MSMMIIALLLSLNWDFLTNTWIWIFLLLLKLLTGNEGFFSNISLTTDINLCKKRFSTFKNKGILFLKFVLAKVLTKTVTLETRSFNSVRSLVFIDWLWKRLTLIYKLIGYCVCVLHKKFPKCLHFLWFFFFSFSFLSLFFDQLASFLSMFYKFFPKIF